LDLYAENVLPVDFSLSTSVYPNGTCNRELYCYEQQIIPKEKIWFGRLQEFSGLLFLVFSQGSKVTFVGDCGY